MNDQAAEFLRTLLPNAASYFLRGVGEKGTDKVTFSESLEVSPVAGWNIHLLRWTEHKIGCFVVPGYVRPGAPASPKEADVVGFTSILVDLDDEGTAERATDYLTRILGAPSIVVASSGRGSPKRHLYWLLDEPAMGEDEVRRVASIRKYLADMVGGDAAFQRIPQIIRLPGTLNQKNGGARTVEMLECDPSRSLDLDAIEELLRDAERPSWAPPPKTTRRITDEEGRLVFTPETGNDPTKRPIADTLHSDVREGGADVNRWGEFSRVAGFQISEARSGRIEVDQAKHNTFGWMLAHMIPPWPGDRFDKEWVGLLERDINTHGPMPPKAKPIMAAAAVARDVTGLQAWATHRWTLGDKPNRKWMVDGLVANGKPHLLVAEGGAGKTFALLELGLKLTAPRFGDRWLGQPLIAPETPRTVVIFTAEDDKDELHIRLEDLDPGGARRREAGDRFIVVPLLSEGGVFRLVERDARGNAVASPAWEETLALLDEIKPDLTGIDTVSATMHGDENASLIAQEWANAANRICARWAGAIIATHHMRKADRQRRTRNAPPRTLEDVREDIRGSNALLGSFRMVIVLYQPDDWKERLTEMQEPVQRGRIFRMGVAKANNPEAMKGERTLLRTKVGTLEDATARDTLDTPLGRTQTAWLVWAIQRAAEAGFPYMKSGQYGINERKAELPTDALKAASRPKLHTTIDLLVAHEAIKQCRLQGEQGMGWLDVPGGVVARGEGRKEPGEYVAPSPAGYEYDPTQDVIVSVR